MNMRNKLANQLPKDLYSIPFFTRSSAKFLNLLETSERSNSIIKQTSLTKTMMVKYKFDQSSNESSGDEEFD